MDDGHFGMKSVESRHIDDCRRFIWIYFYIKRRPYSEAFYTPTISWLIFFLYISLTTKNILAAISDLIDDNVYLCLTQIAALRLAIDYLT